MRVSMIQRTSFSSIAMCRKGDSVNTVEIQYSFVEDTINPSLLSTRVCLLFCFYFIAILKLILNTHGLRLSPSVFHKSRSRQTVNNQFSKQIQRMHFKSVTASLAAAGLFVVSFSSAPITSPDKSLSKDTSATQTTSASNFIEQRLHETPGSTSPTRKGQSSSTHESLEDTKSEQKFGKSIRIFATSVDQLHLIAELHSRIKRSPSEEPSRCH
jgi:hypothetical protein